MTTTSVTYDVDAARRLLRWVAIAAAIDFLLLVPLVIASVSDAENVIHVLGPIHGIGFLIQLFLTVRGAGERMWGWWFPVIVVLTGGPPGALIGHVVVSRQLERSSRVN
jgi:integral membrane protein